MLFQNKLQVSRSQVLQSFWSALMRTKFWKNPKKKKTISDWSIKTCPSYESYFANQKTCGDIDLILTVHLSKSWNDEEKSLFWYKITKPHYNGILFKNIHLHFFFLESHSISFLKIATESFKFANSCALRLQKQQFIAPNASNVRRHD